MEESSALDETHAPKPPIPTISVTRPPPPAAVDLPTVDDILVASESEEPLADGDLESGVAGDEVVMREIVVPPSHSAASPTRTTPTETRQPTVISPTTPTPIPRIITSPPELVDSTLPVSDLLEDPAPQIPTPAITPSPTVSPVKLSEDETVPAPTKEEESPVLVSSPDEGPEATIRLVGGEGVTGSSEGSQDGVLVSEPEEEAVDVPLSDVPLGEAPLASSTETIQKIDKQEKRSSTASKRFSILSASKRKKDSVSSTKDAVAI